MLYKLNNNFYVRSLVLKDLEGPYMDWFEDQEVCEYNAHGKWSKCEDYYKNYISTIGQERNEVIWAICSIDHKHIGNITLTNITFINRRAEFGIIIGDKNYWGTGVALLAAERIISHGFNKLNLNRIYCCVAKTNLGMIKLANSIGMKKEGILRQNNWLNGQWIDDIQYAILYKDFIKN